LPNTAQKGESNEILLKRQQIRDIQSKVKYDGEGSYPNAKEKIASLEKEIKLSTKTDAAITSGIKTGGKAAEIVTPEREFDRVANAIKKGQKVSITQSGEEVGGLINLKGKNIGVIKNALSGLGYTPDYIASQRAVAAGIDELPMGVHPAHYESLGVTREQLVAQEAGETFANRLPQEIKPSLLSKIGKPIQAVVNFLKTQTPTLSKIKGGGGILQALFSGVDLGSTVVGGMSAGESFKTAAFGNGAMSNEMADYAKNQGKQSTIFGMKIPKVLSEVGSIFNPKDLALGADAWASKIAPSIFGKQSLSSLMGDNENQESRISYMTDKLNLSKTKKQMDADDKISNEATGFFNKTEGEIFANRILPSKFQKDKDGNLLAYRGRVGDYHMTKMWDEKARSWVKDTPETEAQYVKNRKELQQRAMGQLSQSQQGLGILQYQNDMASKAASVLTQQKYGDKTPQSVQDEQNKTATKDNALQEIAKNTEGFKDLTQVVGGLNSLIKSLGDVSLLLTKGSSSIITLSPESASLFSLITANITGQPQPAKVRQGT
jgi:hypothetical protein